MATAKDGRPDPRRARRRRPFLFAEGIDNDDDRATLSEEELQAEEEAQIEAATRDTTSAGTDAHSPARSNSSTR